MQLVTLDIYKDKNLIIQFPVFIQPYTQQPLLLYQLETVPVPSQTKYTGALIQTPAIEKTYIALYSETYISI